MCHLDQATEGSAWKDLALVDCGVILIQMIPRCNTALEPLQNRPRELSAGVLVQLQKNKNRNITAKRIRGAKYIHMGKYDDIINLPHHVSNKHPRMPRIDRAAQFGAFAALTGFDDAIDDAARPIYAKIELGEDDLSQLNATLAELAERTDSHPMLTVTYFNSDIAAYATHSGRLRRADLSARQLFFEDGTLIPTDDIFVIITHES